MNTATEQWDVQCFESGTMIVCQANNRGNRGPWLYIYGPRNDDETAYARDRG